MNGDKSWPFVTMSSFQKRANNVLEQSGAVFVGPSPIVSRDERAEWENYTMNSPDAVNYYAESFNYTTRRGYAALDKMHPIEADDAARLDLSSGVASRIYSLDLFQGAKAKIADRKEQYLPAWQMTPFPTKATLINQDRSTNSEGLRHCLLHDAVVFEGLQYARPGFQEDTDPYTAEIAWLLAMKHRNESMYYKGDLFSTVYLPVYSDFLVDRKVVGVVRMILHWAEYFKKILPPSMVGVTLVVDNGCDDPFTYVLNGPEIEPIGVGDLHDPKFNHLEVAADFSSLTSINDGTEHGMKVFQGDCTIAIRIYPTQGLQDSFRTSTPIIITFAVACVFVFAMLMFFCYDRLVERRQKLVLRKAEQTNAIVASLFPKNVRERMMEENQNGNKKDATWKTKAQDDKLGQPIADLFPECTVLFCDISGFTAWSSSRDPTQVFTLLQNIYQAFDKIAQRRKVFKVETIGDSYVAVTGLPEAQPFHAVIMARFASECMAAMRTTVRKLETTLGPETGDLTMRFGLHSGPVTAGVLMGDRARFQLFGDTVNTASRMESTGTRGKIQVSQATADILISAGKTAWVKPREDEIMAKGKGTLRTFWCEVSKTAATSSGSSEVGSSNGVGESPEKHALSNKNDRLVSWMTELFKSYVKEMVAARDGMAKGRYGAASRYVPNEGPPLDEVVEVIELAKFDAKSATQTLRQKGKEVDIPEEVVSLMREFIYTIAGEYHDENPFQ